MNEKQLPLPKIRFNNHFYKIYSFIISIVFVVFLIIFFQGLYSGWLKIEKKEVFQEQTTTTILDFKGLKEALIEEYKDKVPAKWGENLEGVKTRVVTDKKVLALTFDATGIEAGKGYDEELINYLIENKIPATLFLSGLWIDKNPEIVKELAQVEFFEIENLGLNHLPCSLNGKEVYGIKGTQSVEEIIKEIEENALKIAEYTGEKPKFYRPGTAYTDEYCPEIAKKLGYEVVGFSVLGDGGATYSKEKVKNALLNAQPGSIVILHMNIPKSQTYEGLIEAIPLLKEQGFEFVRLKDYPLE
ncbi:MAG: polysaccharide deacetylase family protein [Candidatus Paceibacterota bacterium]